MGDIDTAADAYARLAASLKHVTGSEYEQADRALDALCAEGEWVVIGRPTCEKCDGTGRQPKVMPPRSELEDHWAVCGCHDSWDQCPCASDDHPKDGGCGCCPLGIGLCDPLPCEPCGGSGARLEVVGAAPAPVWVTDNGGRHRVWVERGGE